MRTRTVLGRTLLVALLVTIGALVAAGPAAAYAGPGTNNPPASNWQSRITGFDSPVADVSVEVVDAGQKLRLTNTSGRTVTVIGYQDEPYLRIGPDGVFENTRSPATYLNVSSTGTDAVPDRADPEAAPEWNRVSSGTQATWHDHRAHWMGGDPPDVVTAAPGVDHVVIDRWTVPLDIDGEPTTVAGQLTWVPGPSGWPWALAIVGVATAIAGAAFTVRWRLVTRVATAVLLVAVVVDVSGTWAFSDGGSELIAPVVAVGAILAGQVLLRRRPDDALLLTFVGSATIAALCGWMGREALTSSQLASVWPTLLTRSAVAVSLAVGTGLAGLVVVRSRTSLGALLAGPRGRHSLRQERRGTAETQVDSETRPRESIENAGAQR